MKQEFYDLYQQAKGNNIIFYYCGPVAHASIEGVAQTLRKNLAYEEAGNLTAHSVFSVFVEQMQNILNYSAERIPSTEAAADSELGVGVVVIGHEKDGYFILCGNKVCSEDLPRLTAKLDLIRGMNKEELKAYYKERRRMDPTPESKGAGLGLIEMARKGTEPIEYSFLPIDEKHSFFTIRVVVGR